MTRITNITTHHYTAGNGFVADIEEEADIFNAWIWHESYGVKSHMFGLPRSNPESATLEQAEEIVAANLPRHMENYEYEYMDHEDEG